MYNRNRNVNMACFRRYSEFDKKITDSNSDMKSLNWSSIKTKLIQLAGRHCDSYASDIIDDINSIQEKMDNNVLADKDTFFFGFREMGVDHTNFVQCRKESELNSEYREIWKIDVSIDSEIGVKLELYRVSYNPYDNKNEE